MSENPVCNYLIKALIGICNWKITKMPWNIRIVTCCFLGQGLGITVFGMAYMFVHDGLVHKRFPVGPIANVPYFRRVAAAHSVSVHLVFTVQHII